jgi:translation initiation factor 4E
MYNNTYQTSEVISNTDYLMFKKHIKPEWEDPANRSGGKWVITLPIEDDYEEEILNAWCNLLLHMIGGHFTRQDMEIVNGVIYSIRDKHQRMSIWCNTSPKTSKDSHDTLMNIGQLFKKIVNLPEKYQVSY